MSEVWTQWEGQVVDGFPLRRCLDVSDHSGVFLTEDQAHHLPTAALKLVPAIPTLAESQLAHWTAAAALSHPRLIRLLSMGRCQLDNLHCLYVVMEYAEQNLAHFLAQRALTDMEVREMLPATLDALAFLHSQNFIHGQLKPSNILVVGDQLKLASDTIRPAGEAATSISMVSVYDPPEGRDGSFSSAGDVWALGVTLYEALTQTLPEKPDERSHGVALPPDFPQGCSVVIRECLSRRPVDRPSVASLQTWTNAALQTSAGFAPSGSAGDRFSPAEPLRAAPISASRVNDAAAASPVAQPRAAAPAAVPQPAAVSDPGGRLTIRAVVEREPLPEEVEPRRSLAPFAVAAVVVLIIAWLGMRFFGSSHRATAASVPQATTQLSESGSPPGNTAPTQRPEEALTPTTPSEAPPKNSHNTGANAPSERHSGASKHSASVAPTGTVVHEELPRVSHNSLATIHGRVKVGVRVTVDSSGNVINDTLADPGPSRYFARVAAQAARKWKFAPSGDKGPRQWLVRFEFARSGVTARASEKS